MAARVSKHDHNFRVISHTEDWLKVLVMCSICPETKVWTPKSQRTSQQEFRAMAARLAHLCCQAA